MYRCPNGHRKDLDEYACPVCGSIDVAAIEADLYPRLKNTEISPQELRQMHIRTLTAETYILARVVPARPLLFSTEGAGPRERRPIPLFDVLMWRGYLPVSGELANATPAARERFFEAVRNEIRVYPFRKFVEQRFENDPITLVELVHWAVRRHRRPLEDT